MKGEKESIRFICDSAKISITFCTKNGVNKTYVDSNFYKCFANLRVDNPNMTFFCKGSKVNVHPSGMSAQMSLGLKAYELTMKEIPSFDDVVYIFDYDEQNLTNDPDEQELFYKKWIESRLG